MKKRIFPLILTAALMVGVLSACSDTALKQFDSSTETSSGGYDYAARGEFMAADTLIMTVGDSPVYWDEYYYWMMVAVMNIVNDTGTTSDWTEIHPDSYDMYGQELDYNEFVRYYAYDAVVMYRTIEKKFQESGLSLADGDVYSIQQYMEDLGLETQEELEDTLAQANISQTLFEYIKTVSAQYYALLESVYGQGGADCPDDEVIAFAESQGYVQVKQILFGELDEAKAQAQAVLTELQGGSAEELEQVFTEKMQEYSKDTGLEVYPDGYLFVPGDMDETFEEAAQALAEYQLSGVVETDSGYHILLRIPINPDAVPYSGSETIRYLAAYDRFDSVVVGWQAEMTVTYEDVFDQIVPSEIFVN